MTPSKPFIALRAEDAPPRTKPSNYPEPFASMMAGRLKRPLGDLFGLSNFGVNLTHLAPNSVSALRHAHMKQDEFIYVLQGRPVLITDEGRTQLEPGMYGFQGRYWQRPCAGQRVCRRGGLSEVGDRTGDAATPTIDDLQATLVEGSWKFAHKDGTPY